MIRDLPPVPTHCHCVLVDVFGQEMACKQPTSPDSPFCPTCADRHPEAASFGTKVHAR